jgi:hypothetical protein
MRLSDRQFLYASTNEGTISGPAIFPKATSADRSSQTGTLCALAAPSLLNLWRVLRDAGRGMATGNVVRRLRRGALAALVVAAAAALSGCDTTGSASGELAGFAAGSAAGALTANPFVGVATGLAVRFATSEAESYLERRRQATIHSAIAAAAGGAGEGEVVDWKAEFEIPPRQARGQVQTTRSLGGQIACREVLYNVKGGGAGVGYFVGVICRHDDGVWRWAVSQPTAQRW